VILCLGCCENEEQTTFGEITNKNLIKIYPDSKKVGMWIHIFVFYCSYAAFDVCAFQIPQKTNKNCFKFVRIRK